VNFTLASRRNVRTWLGQWRELLRFSAVVATRLFSRETFRGAAFEVVQKQIYFTAWEILPGFALFVAVLSIVVIAIVGDTAHAFNLYGYALEVVLRLVVLEVLPLLTALFVALRTGAAMNTEVALMQIHNEIEAFEMIGVDPVRYELVPRVIGGTVAVLALTAVAIVIALPLSHLLIVDLRPWSLPPGEFTRAVGKVFDPLALAVLWLKTLAFGFAVTLIPIAHGLAAPKRLAYAPVAVLRGMVHLFFAVMLIEVGALAVTYVL